MLIVYFIVLAFSIILINSIKNRHILFGFLIFIYLLSFISTIILNKFIPQTGILLFPSIYLLFILPFWFVPYKGLLPQDLIDIRYKKNTVKIIIMIVGVFSCAATIYFAYYALFLFKSVDLKIARNLIANGESILPPGLLTTLFITSSSLYFFHLFLFFIAIKDGFKKFYSTLMLLSSFSFPLMVLCFFGRDGVLYWAFNYFVLFLLFKNIMTSSQVRNTGLISLPLLFFFAFIFLLITVSRWGLDQEVVLLKNINYMGQQTQNFSDAFYIDGMSGSLLPGFRKMFMYLGLMDKDYFVKISQLNNSLAGEEEFVFGFYLKEFVWYIGHVGTLLLSVIVFFVATYYKKLFRKKKRLEDIILLFGLYQIPMNGVFYYRQSLSNMDLGICVVFLICLTLKCNFVVSLRRGKIVGRVQPGGQTLPPTSMLRHRRQRLI